MDPNKQQANVVKNNFLVPKSIQAVVIITVSVFVGTFMYYLTEGFFLWNSIDLMSFWIISLVIALILRIDYKSPLFVFNIVLGSLFVSYFQFGQAYLICLLMIIAQKFLRIL